MAVGGEAFDKFAKVFKAGELLFRQGDPGEHMFIIQTGKIEVYLSTPKGEKSLAFFGPGDFFGEMSIIDKAPRSTNARATEETRLILLDERTFDLHVQSNPAIVRKIMKNMSNRLRDMNQQLANLLIKDVNRRIAGRLQLVCAQHGVKGAGGITTFDIPFGENELAKDVGLQDDPAKVHEVIEKLKVTKVIDIQAGKIVVLSIENLDKFIQFLAMKEEFGF